MIYLSIVSYRNGEGVCRFHALTHLSEPTRTYFPKSSLNTLLLTLLPFRGTPRTPANDTERGISRRNSVWSISSRAQSGRFRKAQKRQSTDECPANREFYGYLGPHLAGSSGCHAVFHPLGDLLLIPDNWTEAQLDQLREGSILLQA